PASLQSLLPLLLRNTPPPPTSPLFPYTTLFRSSTPYQQRRRRHELRPVRAEPAVARVRPRQAAGPCGRGAARQGPREDRYPRRGDRKSTRLNSSHVKISYAVFCLKKKKNRLRNI